MRFRSFRDAANPIVTLEDTLAGVTNPAATGAAVLAAQQPITVQAPPPNYTPILIGGSIAVILALVL